MSVNRLDQAQIWQVETFKIYKNTYTSCMSRKPLSFGKFRRLDWYVRGNSDFTMNLWPMMIGLGGIV